jgi:hypothetical protein
MIGKEHVGRPMPKTKRKTPPLQKKVTVYLPTELLERALASTDGNITDTIRKGLELMAASQAYDGLRRLLSRNQVFTWNPQIKFDPVTGSTGSINSSGSS